MNRCSNSHGNMMGQCTCGLFHNPTNSFSMLFSMQAPNQTDVCPFISSSTSSAVDCTLSLGTPSTRLSIENNNFNNNDTGKGVAVQHERRSSYMPNFCWDILQPKHNRSTPPTHNNKSTRGGAHTTNISGGDPLLARRCANCHTTSTPLWRNGPRGPKSLCNACGIRFKKEERRATASAGTTTTSGGTAVVPGGIMESQHIINSSNSWVHHDQYSQSAAEKIPCLSPSFRNEFRFIEDDDRDSETGIPFLSWRLNVTDRPGLVHDLTR